MLRYLLAAACLASAAHPARADEPRRGPNGAFVLAEEGDYSTPR